MEILEKDFVYLKVATVGYADDFKDTFDVCFAHIPKGKKVIH